MAKPYMEPKMRMRHGMSDPPTVMGEDNPDATPDTQTAEEGATAFLPKSVLGGKQWKAGDEIVLTIKAIDPDTGEAEVSYAPEKGGEEPPDTMAAMDQAMPPTEDEGY